MELSRHVWLLLLLCLSPAAVLGEEFVVTETQYGHIRGNVLRDVNNNDYLSHVISYHAVPFAKAQRFGMPDRTAVNTWTGIRETNWTHSKWCPQGGNLDNMSEDCLWANIYTPFESADPGPYAVMVWFYGGAFTSGYNAMYGGHYMATRDVVVVTCNYRVNDFGFAYTGTEACPGNFGLWDQHACMEFVHDNIHHFNGDPDRVTIFGQSAGAASAGHHVVSPHSRDLFHRSIYESGTESNFWSLNWPEQSPENYIWELAGNLNCAPEGISDVDMIECLRALPMEDIIDARFRCTPGHFCQGMGPVVDGPGGFLPDKPDILRASGDIHKGPILSGHTRDDGSLYTIALIPESILGGFNRSEFHYYLTNRLIAIWAPQMKDTNDNQTLENVLHSLDYNYAPWPYVEDEYQNREAFNEMITDAAFGTPWDRQLKDHNQYASSYGYVYNYRGRNSFPPVPEWMGIPHAGDLPQVWGWPLMPLNPHVEKDSGINTNFIDWTDEDRRQTAFWNEMWTNFAKTGNPSPYPVPNPAGDPIVWEPFTPDNMAYLYVNNVTIENRREYRQKSYAFFREYFVDYITRDYFLPFSVQVPEVLEPLSFLKNPSTAQRFTEEGFQSFLKKELHEFTRKKSG